MTDKQYALHASRCGNDAIARRDAGGHGLFEQNVLACFQSGTGDVLVQIIRQHYVDYIEIKACE